VESRTSSVKGETMTELYERREAAERVRCSYGEEVATLRADGDLSSEGLQRKLADAYAKAKSELKMLATSEQADLLARKATLEQRFFGTRKEAVGDERPLPGRGVTRNPQPAATSGHSAASLPETRITWKEPLMPSKPAQSPGSALRSAVVEVYDLEPHEQLLLAQAAHTADVCADLQIVVDRDGPLAPDGRPLPALVELRMQRLALGRLLAALRIPVEDRHLPARSARGFYGVRSVS
jgi:hypothetical protein